jgi:indolepyruvate ferredoxin oxidoreductase
MKIDPRFLAEEGLEVFTGNELLVKGALETEGGVHLLGGYPGSPVADFFETLTRINELLNAKGVRAVINNNEALAAAMLNGSQLAAIRGLIVLKSVGVHVAADALALANLAGANADGGAVVVYGDDPWSDSTQVPADTRYLSKHLFIPTIEPSTAQEVKDWVDLAFKFSRDCELYAGYIITTNLSDGGGSVRCRPNQFPSLTTQQKMVLDTAAIDTDKRVLLPPKTWWQEESLPGRLDRAKQVARDLGLNRLVNPVQGGGLSPVGFVSSGLGYAYLAQALEELGLAGRIPILKLGLSYPVDEEMIAQLAGQCEQIVVIEERRGFMEEQIAEILNGFRQESRPEGDVPLWGKRFPGGQAGLPEIRGLHPSMIISALARLFDALGSKAKGLLEAGGDPLRRELEVIDSTEVTDVGCLPMRLPTFCQSCPHRDSSSICLELKKHFKNPHYMKKHHGRGPVDLMFHGDTGCYTMLMYPPNTPLMHDYSGMGLGAGTGSGIDPFIENKQIVFMGDSTFFHSGQVAISQALKIGQDITFIILDNSITAMTGHQTTPELDYDVVGNPTPTQNIEEVVRGILADADAPLYRVDPSQRRQYKQLLEKVVLSDGVKVIIADKECGITRMRRRRRQEREVIREKKFLPVKKYMNVNVDVCRFCLACAEMTGCPGLKYTATDYGPKMDTDLTLCSNDGACAKVEACSSFEQITIYRSRPPRSKLPELDLDNIPEPRKRTAQLWRCCVTGVGGMGIGLATSVLVRAGHYEGYDVVFVDKKGLAIRNGGVVSQIVFRTQNQEPTTGIIPYGKADLLLGVDVLEAARVLDPRGRARLASKDRTAAVINTAKVQTSTGLLGRDDFDPDALEALIRRHTRGDDFLARDISRICEEYLGSKQYANVMMIGFAFQKGLIPVSMHSMAWAIKDTIRAAWKENLYAFDIGRKLCQRMDLFQGAPRRTGWQETLDEKCRHTIRRYRKGQARADQLRQLVTETCQKLHALDESARRDVVVRTYDCMRWGGMDYAKRYTQRVLDIFEKDREAYGFAATRAVIEGLAGAMLIKDGVFVSELATSPEKHARDRRKYNLNPKNGDRVKYTHLWHWSWKIGRRRLDLRARLPHWLLRVLKRSAWIRKLAPRWHSFEKQYLTRYESTLDAFSHETYEQYEQAIAKLGAPQCMTCQNPRCKEAGCPLQNRIPDWLELYYKGQMRQAADVLHESNNFPEFTSLICPALCQEQCKKALVGHNVEIQKVEREIIEAAWNNGWVKPQRASSRSGRRVAVVGSGPAGLAAAQQLARMGHDVTVYERDEMPGGLLRYGIPAHRLDKGLIDRRLEQLREEGVEFRNAVAVGRDVSAADLRSEYDAICLATGAESPIDLDVPGRHEVEGVHFALDFLRQENRKKLGVYASESGQIDPRDKVVAVIGAGLTGEDCVETALAGGAREVHQVEIRPEQIVAGNGGNGHAHEDASRVHRNWSVATRKFTGQGSRLTELECVPVDWTPSSRGPVMKPHDEKPFRVKTDLALLACGFQASIEQEVIEQLGLRTDSAGRIVVEDQAANVEGVFLAGDVINGASYVATAIYSGRQAAVRIDQYLRRIS